MTQAKRSFPIKSLLQLILVLLVLAPSAAVAQKIKPLNHTRELARQKAERFVAMQRADAAVTPNQASYDAIYYDITLDLNPTTQLLTGSVFMDVAVLSATLTEIELDLLDNMTVTQVYSGGSASTFTHSGDIVTVTLDRTYTLGETATIGVEYNGTPSASYGSFGFDTDSGQPMIWSLSEPYGARSWWPCKDYPTDKADSVDVRVTVPENLIVASNGTLRSEVDNGATKTYHWHEGYPITTYLVSIAVHPYTVFSHWYHYAPDDSMEVRYYVFPDHYGSVQETYAKTVPMIEAFAGIFGEYPFLDEKYGHAEFLWGGGMEHQTITSLGGWKEYLIAHELAHMWWGDMVTCDSFHHIWLNEGFATYSEALWSEHEYGTSFYHANMAAEKYLGGGTIYVEDPSDFGSIFNYNLSYAKASWVLHMLRHVVGDATFFDILRAFYVDVRYQYGTATTEEFRDLCEVVSGLDLDFFFQQWIYEEYYPTYAYAWSAEQNGGFYDIDLTIEQLQSNHIFTMPIDVTVQFASGDTTLVVWDSLVTQDFALTVLDEPTGIVLDKDEWILRSIVEPLADPTFDRGILVVNGVWWSTYGTEITTAYEDSVFWGDHPICFWDVFAEPAGGYPSNLPVPLGHGALPPDTLQQFSTVVWVGNNYGGDLTPWYDTPMFSYLRAGGNLLLMARYGQEFLSEPLRDYLGITWVESATNTLNDCVATYPGLVSMPRIGTQSFCAVFDTSLATSESKLLFKETTTFPPEHRGLGAWRNPAAGGTHRSDGGDLVFLSGRPYRWGHDELRANVQHILDNFFNEPYNPLIGVADSRPSQPFSLGQNYPNPFNPHTTIRFSLPNKSAVDLRVYDVAGRLVKTILSRPYDAGPHTVNWDGTDGNGTRVASGVYFYRLRAGSFEATRKMVLLR